MKRYVLDTNLIIRFLRNDHPTMSRAASALFQESASGNAELILEATLVAEATFVLTFDRDFDKFKDIRRFEPRV